MFVLRAGADLNVVAETLRHPLDPELIALLNDLLQSGKVYYLEGRKILMASSTYDLYRGDLAEAVQRLAELEGLDAVIAAIGLDEKVEIIGRSRRPEIDVGVDCTRIRRRRPCRGRSCQRQRPDAGGSSGTIEQSVDPAIPPRIVGTGDHDHAGEIDCRGCDDF